MPVNWVGLWRVAQAAFGIADASRQFLAPPSRAGAAPDDLGLTRAPAGMLGHLETRLTGVVVSALKEAFDRDAARLDLERAALDDQRRRAEEALRLELIRQAGDRALSRIRSIGALAILIWAVSVVFVMRFPDGLAGAGRIVLGAGWLSLLGATAASFAAHAQLSRWVAAAPLSQARPDTVPEGGVSAAAPWLLLGGLALVGASLLMAI
jgi:hypothetical protein